MGARRLTVDDVSSLAVLRTIWNSEKQIYWTVRFNEMVLRHDPIDYLQWIINARPHLEQLRSELVRGLYRPQSPLFIRGAKGRALSRPLAAPTLEDAIVYRAIVEAASASLLRDTPEYARFGGSQRLRRGREPAQTTYDTWFEVFMRRQGALRTLADKGRLVVESDVSNFFMYINRDRLLAVVTERSILARDSVALLSQVLRAFIPLHRFSAPGPQGLIQGNFDASRILAHVYVDLLDDAFRNEGEAGRYCRWVDDIVVSVGTEAEATDVISGIQLALEPIGLAPHPSKTRHLSKVAWEDEHYPSFNEYLDRLEERLKAGRPVNEQVFLSKFRDFLRARPTRYRIRVLRRFFTAAKAIETPALRRFAPSMLQEAPDVARWILGYLSIFPLTVRSVERAFELCDQLGDVYQDLHILIVEYLLIAPNKNRKKLRCKIAKLARVRIEKLLTVEEPAAAYLAGLLTLLLFKFGFASDLEFVYDHYQRRWPVVDDFTSYAFVCLGSVPKYRSAMIRSLGEVDDTSMTRIAHGLNSLENADERVFKAIKKYLRVISRHRPKRLTFRPRALPCLYYLGRAPIVRSASIQFMRQTLERLRTTPGPLRDERAMAHLRSAIPPR